nr:MAG TPA: hypothetical protein [Caudoviricetes sp.]
MYEHDIYYVMSAADSPNLISVIVIPYELI